MLSEESRIALHLFFIRAGRYVGKGIHEMGLTHGEAKVIKTIHLQGQNDCMNPSAVSEALGVRQPTLTPIFNSLEARGYIDRVRDKLDRRKVNISLTDKCRSDFKSSLSKGNRFISQLEECLTPEELAQLLDIMRKVDGHIKSEQEKQREENHAHHNPLP